MSEPDNSSDSSGTGKAPKECDSSDRRYAEDTDNRGLWQPETKYLSRHVGQQRREAVYILAVLILALLALIAVSVGCVERLLMLVGLDSASTVVARRFGWLCAGGLLGGTVYSAKWLYHSIAKGIWHEDRMVWRYLTPWISLGTTVGVGALVFAGFFKGVDSSSGATCTGVGFLIGYLSDRFLAKMKDIAQVMFGETESHYQRRDRNDPTSRK